MKDRNKISPAFLGKMTQTQARALVHSILLCSASEVILDGTFFNVWGKH